MIKKLLQALRGAKKTKKAGIRGKTRTAAKKEGPVFKPMAASYLKKFKKELVILQQTLSRKLEEKRNKELIPATEMDPGDDADVAVQTYEKEMLFEISGSERGTLMEIEEALYRIENKTFSQCQRCKKVIPLKRLRVLPYTKYCLKCQTLIEPIRASL
ncbi:MAG: TraR/DksA family transcriptional regulator [Elusimicrobia bacterium]|nr:TraR/DksA family transcriptional regulator [Elusimicrobiota bacterium]